MSSKNQTRRVEGKGPEQEPDLSIQYREIGIKAVAAAAHDKAKEAGVPGGPKEQEKRTKEKVSG